MAKGCQANLYWSSETEENFSHYEVQWSGDGRNFQTIHQVKGAGGLNGAQHYQYLDKAAGVHNYYRLKMVDHDGTTEYSDVINVDTQCDDFYGLMVFPNPVSVEEAKIQVKYKSEREVVDLVVVDVLGKILIQEQHQVVAEWNTATLDVSQLPVGTYLVKQVGARGAKRFVIQE